MIPYILCPSCQFDIGSIYLAFVELRRRKCIKAYEEFDSIDPSMIAITDIEVDLSDIFDELGVEAMCCRAHLHTQVNMDDL